MTATDFRRYLESMETGAIPILGSLILYSVPDSVRVTPADLRALFTKHGVDEAFMPPPLNPQNAFRKATGPSMARTSYTVRNGLTDCKVSLYFEDVSITTERFTRFLVRSMADPEKVKLTHDSRIGEAVYYKPGPGGTSRVRFEVSEDLTPHGISDAEVQRQIAPFVQTAEGHYREMAENYDGVAVRSIFRDLLADLNAVLVNDKGVYFGTRLQDVKLDRLRAFMTEVDKRIQLHLIPVPDTIDQRTFIADAVANETVTDCQRLIDEVRAGSITQGALDRARDRLREIRNRQTEVATLVEVGSEQAELEIERVQRVLLSLLDKVER